MIKVLLVDDHELIRTGVKGLLDKASDIEVAGEASNGEEAIDLVKKASPDVVLMDVSMPGMGGIEATRRVLRVKPDLKVIALTVLDEDPFPSRLHEVGAMGFLTKGCPADEMLLAIRAVYSGRHYIASDVAMKHTLTEWQGNSTNPFKALSSRETQVLLQILEGQKNQEISDILSLSPKTVSTYRQRIYEKLDIKNDVELTRLAYRHGILKDGENN
ncbi:MAG: response regulator [Candidatus Thiodiazotropha sp. (ex Epidulcina cf. delphinae)]|nr:response regulator [Candidatus Thiodiazotropha sp. (ex Epidulcina cf. delphinae)]